MAATLIEHFGWRHANVILPVPGVLARSPEELLVPKEALAR